MVAEVIPLRPCADVATGLRNIADAIEAGEYAYTANCTVILGEAIHHLGEVDDSRAAVNTVWDLTYAIGQLMAAGRGAS